MVKNGTPARQGECWPSSWMEGAGVSTNVEC